MSKAYYLPTSDEQRAIWLNNFAAKLPTLAAKYNISATEQADVTQSAVYFDALIKLKNQFVTFQSSLISFKNAMRNGEQVGATITTFPIVPTATLPTAPAFDIFGRMTAIVAKIKTSYQYVETDGQNLGIEGAEISSIAAPTLKPALSVIMAASGKPEIVWKKDGMTAIEIEVNRGGTGWQYLAIDTIPNYIDNHPLPTAGQTAIWSYRAIYRLRDEQLGQWSDVVDFTVTGK